MSSRSDTQISDRLSIQVDLLGYAFEEGGCCRLHGVSGADMDYVEELTVTQAVALVWELQRAIRERTFTILAEHPPTELKTK